MWSHVKLVSQTTVLLIESRLLLYSISLSRTIIYVFNQVSSICSSYTTDYAIMCVRMYKCIPVGAYAFSSIIFHFRITTFITILMAICFTLIFILIITPYYNAQLIELVK